MQLGHLRPTPWTQALEASNVIVQAHDEKHVLLVLQRLAEIYTCNQMFQSRSLVCSMQ